MSAAADRLQLLFALALACAILSFAANRLLMPLYRRYGLARPNARSSHHSPTPQGGGAGVLVALLAGLCALGVTAAGASLWSLSYAELAAGALLLAITGAFDDVFTLRVRPRLAAQLTAAGLALLSVLSAGTDLLTGVPLILSVPVLLAGLVWFVNLTNFMDGIDGITIAEFVPICGALAVLAAQGAIGFSDGAIAAGLLGALAGFAPFNRHVARLFLGDVGSLWIGLVAGALLLRLALGGQPVAGLILPLYYLADATITLARRLWRGEDVTQAHRTHFYQRATDLGWKVPAITWLVWRFNAALALLALAAVWFENMPMRALLLLAAAVLVGWLLALLSRPPAS